MKKIFTLVGGMLASIFAVSANPIFSCDFNNGEFASWTVVDANNDSTTWIVEQQVEGDSIAQYPYSFTEAANDWLISPAITVETSGIYMLSFDYHGSNYGEEMDVYYGTAPTVEAMSNLIVDLGVFYHSSLQPGNAFVELTAGETIHLGFHCNSKPNLFRVLFDNVVLEASEGVDVGVTAVTSPITGKELSQEVVTIEVANSGLCEVSNIPVAYALVGGDTIREVVAQTIAVGDTVSYTFTQTVDLSTPRVNYVINAWSEEPRDLIVGNNGSSTEVRHIAPGTIPYYMGFEEDQDPGSVLIFNLNEDDGNWSVEQDGWFARFARTGSYSMCYGYDKENAGNDWYILEPIIMEPGYYSLKFWYSSLQDHFERLGVYYGTEQTPEAMTNFVVEYNPYYSVEYLESANVIHITEAGEYCFGFKAFSDKNENWICTDDISIERIENPIPVDVTISALNNPTSTYMRSQLDSEISVDVSNNGVDTAAGAIVTISIDGAAIFADTIDLAPQSTQTLVVPEALSALAYGDHQINVTIAHPEDASADNNQLNYDLKAMGDAAVMYDFENGGALPADFTFIANDGATVHETMLDLFPNSEAWATVELYEGPIFGAWMIGATSYLNDSIQADRWMILPAYTVPTNDAAIVWTANSMDPNFLDNYEVLIAENSTDMDDFVSVAQYTETGIAETPATRGIELGAYEGKTINVAFRLNTRDGYMLTMDNIGFYNSAVTSGVANNSTSNFAAYVANDMLHVQGAAVAAIEIHNIAGSLVLQATTSNLSLSELVSGVYIATITSTEGETISVKISK